MREIKTVSINVDYCGKPVRTLIITFEDGEVFTTTKHVCISEMISDDCVPVISKNNSKRICFTLDSDKVMQVYDRLKNVKNTRMVDSE